MCLTPRQVDRLNKALEGTRKKSEARIKEYESKPNLCSNCEKPLDYKRRKNRFCSHSCSAAFNNQGKCRNYVEGKYVNKPCIECGATTRNTKFCSRTCSADYHRKKRSLVIIESGVAEGKSETIKKYLASFFGRKCSVCGTTEWMGQEVPLVLDHINGKPSDNRIDNLRLVCGNCNMQLPTFAGRNIGKEGGRPYRKMRYAMGLSY